MDNLQLRLEPKEAYIDDVYTFPSYRRRGIQAALQTQQLQNLREHGFERAVAIVALDNIPSQWLFRKMGYTEAERLSFRRILLKRYYFYQNHRF